MHQQNVQIVSRFPLFSTGFWVPRNLERKFVTKIIRFSYDFVVPEPTLSAGFHEKGHRSPGSGVSIGGSRVAQLEKPLETKMHDY